MKKEKILHLTEAFGGVFVFINYISIELEKEFEVSLIYGSNREDAKSSQALEDYKKKFKTFPINFSTDVSLFNDLVCAIKMIELFNKIKPDIIHLHSSKAGVLGKLISWFYPNIDFYYTPHGYSFLRKDISKFKRIFYYSIEYFSQKISRVKIIASGNSEYKVAKKIGDSFLVNNGIRIKDFERVKNEKKADKGLIIGTVGRICYQKNPALFNQIALKLPEIQFVWIGSGELEKELSAPNITITGFLEKNEAIEVWRKFDVYLQTSLWEGLPLAPLESMAMEIPIVANEAPGNVDVVKHNITGYIFRKSNEGVQYLNKLLNDKNLREDMGRNGFKYCTEVFNLDRNIADLCKVYQNKGE